MFNAEEIQKIISDLKRVGTEIPEQDLEKTAQNLYGLALFVVQRHFKQHFKTNKPHKGEDYGQETTRAP